MRGLALQPYLLTSGAGRGAEGWAAHQWPMVYHQSRLHNGISYETGFEELPGWYMHPRGQKLLCSGHFRPHPIHLFLWLFICVLYKILIINGTRKQSVSRSSESHCSRLLNLRSMSWKPPIYSWLVEGQRPGTCNWHLEWGAGLWGWALHLWALH